MSEPKITIFDLLSVCKPQAWSPNTWKARFVLNYKQIPYKTVWVSFDDIEETLKKIGGKPTGVKFNKGSNAPLYTLPALLDESEETPVVVADSLAIAEYLDEKYPDRPVLPKGRRALEHVFERFFDLNLSSCLYPRGLMVRPSSEIIGEKAKPWFHQTRWEWFNIKVSELSCEGPVREGHWNNFMAKLDELANILDKNGPDAEWVAGGSEPTRADFIIASWLIWIKIVSPDEWDKKVRPLNGGRWEKLLDKTKVWQAAE